MDPHDPAPLVPFVTGILSDVMGKAGGQGKHVRDPWTEMPASHHVSKARGHLAAWARESTRDDHLRNAMVRCVMALWREEVDGCPTNPR